MASGDLIPRVYSNFRGVDFRGEEINLMRSPDSLNMWKDYKETESIRTRPKLRSPDTEGYDYSFYGTIWGMYFYTDTINHKERMLVHCGKRLYEIIDGAFKVKTHNNSSDILKDAIEINNAKSGAFIYENKWYFKDGLKYFVYDGEFLKEVEGYVPTTSIGRNPLGGGKTLEDVNLLTGRRINTFLANGKDSEFHLDAQNIDTDFEPIVRVNGSIVADGSPYFYKVDSELGVITFYADESCTAQIAPSHHGTDGQDDISIEFRKTIPGYREKIEKCTLLEVFDNRVFFSGNPDYPNYVWHCSLDNPAYCSDLDYYIEGLDTAKVTGMVAGNNALWVFKEPSQSNTSVYYHMPTIDAEYGKVYPSVHSNISLGCVGGAVNFNDDIVFFSQRGMEGVNGDVTTEQAVAHRSSLVDRRLLTEADYKNMILVEWEGYLLCFMGNKAYLADSRAKFTNEDHFEYEWFYWELDKIVTCATIHNGVLYVSAHEEGRNTNYIYSLTDTKGAVESYWVTPLDKFKHPQYQKTTNKRGCVVEATGDVSVYAKTDKTDFEKIGEYNGITDYFVCRIKRKKFKDIQLKFHSNTRFSLEQATLECFIGGYVKR